MSSRHIAVWIDHQEARIFHVSAEGFDESTIHSPHAHVHRHPKGTVGYGEHPDDAHKFFRDVAHALAGDVEVVVLGPSTAKLQFFRYAQEHAPQVARAILGLETVDHPTDPQIVAYARRYFKAADRML